MAKTYGLAALARDEAVSMSDLLTILMKARRACFPEAMRVTCCGEGFIVNSLFTGRAVAGRNALAPLAYRGSDVPPKKWTRR